MSSTVMDRSISFSTSGSLTRDHSPERVRQKLAELESNLSALGHVGLIKYQRNLLRTELKKQTYLTDHARQSASSLRKLALRLAINVSVKDSKLKSTSKALSRSRLDHYRDGRTNEDYAKQLLSVLKRYERQGEELLYEFNKKDADRTNNTLPEALQLQSPPPSPRSFKSSIRSSSSSAASFNLNFDQLPSEIFQICKDRVHSLLKDYEHSQSTISELSDSRSALKKALEDHEEQAQCLLKDRDLYASQLETARNHLARLGQELCDKTEIIQDLEEAKSLADQDLQSHKSQIDGLQAAGGQEASRSKSLQERMSNLQHELDSEQRRLRKLQENFEVKERAISEYEDQITKFKVSSQDMQRQLHAANTQLQCLQDEAENVRSSLEKSREAQSRLEEEKNKLEMDLAASTVFRQENEIRIHGLQTELEAAYDARARIIRELQEEQKALKTSRETEQSLSKTIREYEQTIWRLEGALRDLQHDFEATRSMLANFAQTAARLSHELQSEKQRSLSLGMSESALRSTLQDFEEQNLHLQREVDSLQSQLSSEKDICEAARKANCDTQAKLVEAEEMLWNVRNEYEDKIGALIAAEVLLKGEVEELKSRSRNVEGAKADLELDSSEHRAELQDLRREHEDKIGAYLATEVVLKGDLDAAKSECRAANEAKIRLECALEEINASAEHCSAEKQTRSAELQEERAKASRDIEAARAECEVLKTAQAKLLIETESERNRREQLQEELEKNQARVRELEGVMATGREETTKLRLSLGDLERAKHELQKDIDSTRGELEDSRRAIETLQENDKKLRSQLHDADVSCRGLDEELSAVRMSNQSLMTELREMRLELSAAIESRELHSRSSGTAEAKITDLQHQIANYEAELAKSRHREAEGHRKLLAVENIKLNLETDAVECGFRLSVLNSQRNELGSQLSFLEVAKTQLENDLQSCREQLRNSENDNTTLREEMESLSYALTSLKTRLNDSETTSECLKAELQSARYALTAAKDRLEGLKHELEASRSRVGALEAENKILTAEREAQGHSLRSLKSQHQKVIARLAAAVECKGLLDKQFQDHRQSFDSMESQHRDAFIPLDSIAEDNASINDKQDGNSCGEQKAEHKEMIAAMPALESQTRLMKSENISLQEKLRRSQAIRTSHKKALDNIRVRLGMSKMSQRNIKAKLKAAQQELEELTKQNTELRPALESALAALHAAQCEKDVTAGRIEMLEATITGLNQEKIDAERQFDAAISAMTTELEAAKEHTTSREMETSLRLKGLQQVINEMKQEQLQGEERNKAALTTAFADLEIEKRKGVDANSAASSQIQKLENQVIGLQNEIQDLRGQLSAAQTIVSALEEALERSHEQGTALREDVSYLTGALSNSEDQLAVLKQQLEKAQAAHDANLNSSADKESRILELQKENQAIIARLEVDLAQMTNIHVSDVEAVRVKEELIASLSEENQRLSQELKASREAVAIKEIEIENLAQQVENFQSIFCDSSLSVGDHNQGMNTKGMTIAALRAQIDTQRRLVEDSQSRANELEYDLNAKHTQTEKLRQLNKDYASLVSSLQAEVRGLRVSKERLTATVEELRERKRSPQSETLHRPTSVPMLTSDPLSPVEESNLESSGKDVSESAEVQIAEAEAATSSDLDERKMSTSPSTANRRVASTSNASKRVVSSYSDRSLKAYRVLGAEAAAGRLHNARVKKSANCTATTAPTSSVQNEDENGEMKKKLRDLWEEQQRAPIMQASTKQEVDVINCGGNGDGLEEPYSHVPFGSKRSRRKLQKKRRLPGDRSGPDIENETSAAIVAPSCNGQGGHGHEREHGRLWNFMMYGILKRVARDTEGRPIRKL